MQFGSRCVRYRWLTVHAVQFGSRCAQCSLAHGARSAHSITIPRSLAHDAHHVHSIGVPSLDSIMVRMVQFRSSLTGGWAGWVGCSFTENVRIMMEATRLFSFVEPPARPVQVHTHTHTHTHNHPGQHTHNHPGQHTHKQSTNPFRPRPVPHTHTHNHVRTHANTRTLSLSHTHTHNHAPAHKGERVFEGGGEGLRFE